MDKKAKKYDLLVQVIEAMVDDLDTATKPIDVDDLVYWLKEDVLDRVESGQLVNQANEWVYEYEVVGEKSKASVSDVWSIGA